MEPSSEGRPARKANRSLLLACLYPQETDLEGLGLRLCSPRFESVIRAEPGMRWLREQGEVRGEGGTRRMRVERAVGQDSVV